MGDGWTRGQNIPDGSKGEVTERGMGLGKKLFCGERLRNWKAGARKGRSGSVGSHKKPSSKEPGHCSQAGPFSFGRMAVSYLSQM